MDSPIEIVVVPSTRELINGFKVRRALPTVRRRMVGPFAFVDEMGPESFPQGAGLDVPPHPHIGLATVTYLFDGELVHRDSIGSEQIIRPGDLNWMTAGRGIAHSERSAERERETRLAGVQAWVALPVSDEEAEPSFVHHDSTELPLVEGDGTAARVIAGEAFGARSPVSTLSPLFYADVTLRTGTRLQLENVYSERAIYIISGSVKIDDANYPAGQLLVLRPGSNVIVDSADGARFMLFGGEPLPERRYIWWNFVSSSRDRIEQAKREWRERKFPLIPGDATEFVPLPATYPAVVNYP